MRKLQKFSLTLFWKKFRESNVFTIEVAKELFSRKVFSVRENFSFFHSVSVEITEIFDKNFVKVPFLLKKILKSRFDEIFFG